MLHGLPTGIPLIKFCRQNSSIINVENNQMTEEFLDYFDLNSYWNLKTTLFIKNRNSNRNYRWPRIAKKLTREITKRQKKESE